jgi:hypothetical protein
LADQYGPITRVDELLERPFVLIGGVEEIADQVRDGPLHGCLDR